VNLEERLGFGFLVAGVAVLLTATVDVVWTDLPDPSTMDGHGGGGSPSRSLSSLWRWWDSSSVGA
jgi:hypothetical protein